MTGRGPKEPASETDFPRTSYRLVLWSLLDRRGAVHSVTNHIDAGARVASLVERDFHLVDVGDAAQGERERAGLARRRENHGLFGLQLERRGLADDDVLAVLFLRGLIDGENANIRENDLRDDEVGR